MSLLGLLERSGRLEIRSPMRPGFRVALMLVGVVPLLAPYELVVRVGWQDSSASPGVTAHDTAAAAADPSDERAERGTNYWPGLSFISSSAGNGTRCIESSACSAMRGPTPRSVR